LVETELRKRTGALQRLFWGERRRKKQKGVSPPNRGFRDYRRYTNKKPQRIEIIITKEKTMLKKLINNKKENEHFTRKQKR
jgi:hypothetical protein